MKGNEIYGAIGLVGITALVSWICSCEVLFIMGIVIIIVLSSLVGLVLGSIMLTDRLFVEKVRPRAEWMGPRTSVTR